MANLIYAGFESIIHECTYAYCAIRWPLRNVPSVLCLSLGIRLHSPSRPMVQLPRYQVSRRQWTIQLLGLVRRPDLASSRTCYWRHALPRSHGHQRRNLSLAALTRYTC